MSAASGRGGSEVTYLSETTGVKRKANDKSAPIANKKSANHVSMKLSSSKISLNNNILLHFIKICYKNYK